ncbi:MAG: hypothetical protein RBS77_02895 [Candidatus Moranbacteria bacterium]|jgi:hypothetical protein|nr:hypothetical protein [Candidatus Moranbacteria bacterium]
MSFLGLFKPRKEKEMDKIWAKIDNGVFPGGKKQMEKEVDEVSRLLGDKYPRAQLREAYVHIAFLFFIAEDKSEERVVKSTMIKMDEKIAREDILKIYSYVENKFLMKRYLEAIDNLNLNKSSEGILNKNKDVLNKENKIVPKKGAEEIIECVNKNRTFKKDFGSSIKNAGYQDGGTVIITSDFTPLNLVSYPGGLCSITANVDGMVASFDFNKEILQVFLDIFEKFGKINKKYFNDLIQENPTKISLIKLTDSPSLIKITGMVITCKLSKAEKSETTSEDFIPLIITETKIVQNPVGVLVPTSLESF